MNLFDPTQNLLEAAMRGAAQRQSALSRNLANANTPGYQRLDVDFHSALQDAWSNTNVGRAPSAGGVLHDTAFETQADNAATMRQDGGTVDLDVEASNLAANGLEYEALVSVARARNEILKSALGG